MNLNHKGLSSPVSLLTQAPLHVASGPAQVVQQTTKHAEKKFLTFQLNT